MSIRPITVLGFIGCVSLAVGCGGAKAHEDDSDLSAALESDNGAMDRRDEPVEFGDPEVSALANFDATQIDAVDMTVEAASRPDAHSYRIALLWGHLPAPSDGTATDLAPAPVDWSGSISVDAGAIGVKKTLLFDAHDSVAPRTEAAQVSFTSHTLPFVDGLFLHVVVPAGGSTLLHVNTTALRTDIDLSTLGATEGGVDRLGDGRNGLAYIGYEDVAGCARGLLFGRWIKARPALGRFRGRVVDGNGDRIGDIRGIWGHAPRRDADVFFGKYISVDGTTHGLFGGRYDDGAFKGLWGTRDPQ